MYRVILLSTAMMLVLWSCGDKKQPETTTPEAGNPVTPVPVVPKTLTYDRLDRETFNKVAVRLNLPLFWINDANKNKTVEPNEVTGLLFYSTTGMWVNNGAFTKEFADTYEKMVAAHATPIPKTVCCKERLRRELVISDLDQGRPTLVHTDTSVFTAEEKIFARHMYTISLLMDKLYALQTGTAGLEKQIAADDPASWRLFMRNLTTKCVAPKTEKNENCASIKGVTPLPGVYPAELQKDDKDRKFCENLDKLDKKTKQDSKKLLYQFNAVRMVKGKLTAVPYTVAFKEIMTQLSDELTKTAGDIKDPNEKALKEYLVAAAKAFKDNNWYEADKKWVAMSSKNSKWYVRIGPDEVYWDPCNRKAGFHVTFSRINPDSIAWQKKIEPIKNAMEKDLATLIGRPYRARKIGLHLPDFINIIANAGNDRSPMGATIGQSLPNWGPVAKKGGRTVVMTNLYTDADSLLMSRHKAESLFTKESLTYFTDKQGPSTFSIILHEITHNLGPSHEYKIRGKKDVDLFGGALATTMEELKAQTGALWYVDYFLKKKLITADFAKQTYVDSIHWAFGHISRGMKSASGRPRPYSQLAAIQVGFLMKEGAMVFDKNVMAANGKDKGAFVLHLDKFPAAINKLMKLVGMIKAKGLKKEALSLISQFVDSNYLPHAEIAQRILRYPKASFVYSWNL
ncbi:hypothetical protein KKF84_00285 [Myxococcota bacterium]|nr:hypothetical protein [Myxococcota bacterium]MBU1533721.1 hypothetical protein [Myxococcota bacterium]